MPYSRRKFMSHAGQILAATGTVGHFAPNLLRNRVMAPSDTMVVGLIGCRGMGFGDLRNHLNLPDVVCGGLCDVDEDVLNGRANDVEQMTGQRPRLYRDFRKMLEEPDIDAVIIGTPDHWHALQMVHACQAGKHVYVEKPMANSIAECDLMVQAAHQYKRIVQIGQQQRSGQHWKDVVDFVQSGKLGQIRHVKVWGYFNYGQGGPRVPDETPPANLDYDMWLGPARDQPYNASRLHGNWRHQWSFGGGLLTDWGVHLLDIVLWAMKVDRAPKSVAAVGSIYVYKDRAIETPDTLSVLYDLEDFTLSWEHAGGIEKSIYDRNYGMAFIGENGTLVANRSGWEVISEDAGDAYRMVAIPPRQGKQSYHQEHAANFVDAVKNNVQPVCTVENGRMAAFYAHLGNIAHRTGETLKWDEKSRQFAGNEKANALIKPAYRGPWKWPSV